MNRRRPHRETEAGISTIKREAGGHENECRPDNDQLLLAHRDPGKTDGGLWSATW